MNRVEVRAGQVWRSRDTGNRWRVEFVGEPFGGDPRLARVAVRRLPLGPANPGVPDSAYHWTAAAFEEGMELEPPAGHVPVDGGRFLVPPPAPGRRVRLDSGREGRLLPGTWPEAAPFNFPSDWREGGVPARVEVTGRKLARKWGDYWVRVRVTWPGDGEPGAACGGWMLSEHVSSE